MGHVVHFSIPSTTPKNISPLFVTDRIPFLYRAVLRMLHELENIHADQVSAQMKDHLRDVLPISAVNLVARFNGRPMLTAV